MPRETISPSTGAQRLTKLSKFIPKAINSTPTTSKQSNAPNTPQLGPKEHRIWHNEDPNKDIFSHPQITLANYTPHHVPHLDLNPVTHQGHIYSRDLDNQLTDPNYGRGTDGKTQTHGGGT